MRSSCAFFLGTITGAVVMGLWGRQIVGFVTDSTRGVRARAAEGFRTVEEKTDEVLDRGVRSLHRAEEVLESTKEHVSEVLRAGGDAIRP